MHALAALRFPAPRGVQVAEGGQCARWTCSKSQRWQTWQPHQAWCWNLKTCGREGKALVAPSQCLVPPHTGMHHFRTTSAPLGPQTALRSQRLQTIGAPPLLPGSSPLYNPASPSCTRASLSAMVQYFTQGSAAACPRACLPGLLLLPSQHVSVLAHYVHPQHHVILPARPSAWSYCFSPQALHRQATLPAGQAPSRPH